jgi:hypothetical protein
MIAPHLRKFILAGFAALSLFSSVGAALAQPAPVPALPDSERRTSYSISASNCSCNVNFALFGDSTDVANWLEVFVNGVLMPQSGNWTITSPTGPLATIPRPITDGVLTFTSAQTGTVQIVGARRPRRASQFSENQGVSARNLNQVITDIVAMLREVWDKINDVTGRSLLTQPGNTLGMLPLPSACISALMGFDTSGLNPICVPQIGSGVIALPSVGVFTSSHGIAPSDCNSIMKMGSGSTWPLALSLPATTGFTGPCPIYIVGQALRGVQLSNFTGLGLTSPDILWPTKSFAIAIVNGAWTLTVADGRWKAPNNVQLFMDVVNGNDGNDCLAAGTGNACKTFQQVIRTNLKDDFDLTAQSAFPQCEVTVNLADNRSSGVSYGLAHIAFNPIGAEGRGTLCIVGDAATPSNVVVSDSAGGNISAFGNVNVQLSNLQIGWENPATTPIANSGVDAEDGANIWLQPGVIFGSATDAQINAGNHGSVIALHGFSVSGGATNLIAVASGGQVDLTGQTVTFSNAPIYTGQTVVGFSGTTTILSGVTWTNGNTVTGPKFFCRGATTIETDTGSGASIPGTVAGATGVGCIVF